VPASDNLKQDSELILDQLRAIDNNRIIKGPLTIIEPPLMKLVNNALYEVLDMVNP